MSLFKRRVSYLARLALVLGFLAAACGTNQNFVSLNSDDPVAELADGLTVSANPNNLPAGFGVQLAAVPAADFKDGTAGEAWAPALAGLPGYLQLQSPVFSIKTQGDQPEQLFLSVIVPAGANARQLDLYAWDGTAWTFLPAQVRGGQLVAAVSQAPAALALFASAQLPPLALTILEPGQALIPSVADAVNAVLLGGVLAQPDGSLGGQVPGVDLDGNYAVYPVVRGADAATLEGLLADPAAIEAHLQNLVGFVVGDNYDGLVLDFQGLSPAAGPAYAQFAHDLAGQLHAQGLGLLIQVPVPARNGDVFDSGAYDWRALGDAADALLVTTGNDPTAFGNGQVDTLLAWAVGEVPRGRLRLLTSALSAEHTGGVFSLINQAAALAPLGSVTLEQAEALEPGKPITVKLSGAVETLAYDPLAFAASYSYTDAGNTARTVWLTAADTLRQRLLLAENFQLGGVVVNDLVAGGVPAELVNAVTQYKASVEAAAVAHAELLWTVTNGGTTMALATAQPGQPYTYIAPSAGSYEFSVQLQPGSANDLGSVAVQIAAVTSTPTPTSTPTATATTGGGGIQQPQATVDPNATAAPPATAAPTSSGGGGVFVPPPPIGAGTFELGGQVPGNIGHLAQMQQAGMHWVKFQATGDAAGYIAAAHGAGFKVLLSAVGDKSRAADPAYWPEYAGWVAGLAASGADAIEVWNEANIDREWPNGQINGATYTELLKQAYNAIKGANGGTIVISGAPAPTGAAGSAGCVAAFCNDDAFLQQMANAGAASYMDCVGVHFNTGTTSPNDTTGSALSGYHYSYYFWPMVNLYWGAFGGTRPLCFTELGYLTSDGYGSLPGYFSWAASTSVAEQAQWLAELASLAGNSGQVRLMIVFNVDFTLYGDDPQAGYAMLRPDGSCPACASLERSFINPAHAAARPGTSRAAALCLAVEVSVSDTIPSMPVPEKDPTATRPADASANDTSPMQTPVVPAAGDTLIGRAQAAPPADPPPPPPAAPPPPPPAGPPPGMSIAMILGIFGLALVGIVLLGVGIFAVARLTAPTQVAGVTATATQIALPTTIVDIPTTTPQPTATNTAPPTATDTAAPPTATATEATADPDVTAGATQTGGGEGGQMLTIISGANVRGGPGTEYEVIGGIKEGDSVPLLGISAGGGWYAIDFGSAQEGRAWVSAQVATFDGSDSDLTIVPAPPKPAATATSKPVNNPAPGPLAGTHGVSGQLRMCGGKLSFAVNERVCFIEWIKNTTAAPVSYGVLGVQAVSLNGGGTKFQTSWDANAVADGFLWIDPGCIGPTDRCNGEWEDGMRLSSAGNWRLTLTVCFSNFSTCLNAGDWEALSVPITVAIN